MTCSVVINAAKMICVELLLLQSFHLIVDNMFKDELKVLGQIF